MLANLLRMKSPLLLLGLASFLGGVRAAFHDPSRVVSESRRGADGSVSGTFGVESTHTHPTRGQCGWFLGLAAVCVVATAAVHVAELRHASAPAGDRGFDLVE